MNEKKNNPISLQFLLHRSSIEWYVTILDIIVHFLACRPQPIGENSRNKQDVGSQTSTSISNRRLWSYGTPLLPNITHDIIICNAVKRARHTKYAVQIKNEREKKTDRPDPD